MSMSGYRAHIAFYLAFTAAFIYLVGKTGLQFTFGLYEASCVAVGVLYSILPDLDSPTSKARDILNKGTVTAALLMLVFYSITGDQRLLFASAAVSATLLFLWSTRHRGMMHTTTAAVLFSAPLLLVGPYHFACALAGYETHLFLDGKLL